MHIIVTITPSTETVHPSIDIMLSIQYREDTTIPLQIHGIVMSEEKRVLGHFSEVPSKNTNNFPIRAFHYSQQRNPRDLQLIKTFRLTLDSKTLDYVENLRQKNKKGDVMIFLDLNILYLEGKVEIGGYSTEPANMAGLNGRKIDVELIKLDSQRPNLSNTHLRMMVPSSGEYSYLNFREEPTTLSYIIKGSDWINDFQPQLGIGKFLVMEIPEIITLVEPKDEFEKRLQTATERLREIGELLRKGEWDDVAEDCRGIYEDLKKNFKPQFESSVEDLLRDGNNISNDGITAFKEIIKNLHDFSHEFHHYRDKDGKAKQVSVHKEDAYALYVTLVGLINMLTVKYHRLRKLNAREN